MPVSKKNLTILGAVALALVAGVLGWGYHAWNRGIIDEAKRTAPDGINVSPIPGQPGSYLVNPRFSRIASVQTLQNQTPNPDGPPPIIQDIRPKHWRYDSASSRLTLDQPMDDKEYMLTVQGNFAYPLVFYVSPTIKPDSIRAIVAGKIGIANEDYRLNEATGSIVLPGTTPATPWFALVYETADGNSSIGSLSADQLTRAMRVHLGLPLEGNCAALDKEGRRFQTEAGSPTMPWIVELLPAKEGYRGQSLWPRDYTWSKATGILELKKPIKPGDYSVLAYYWEKEP